MRFERLKWGRIADDMPTGTQKPKAASDPTKYQPVAVR